LEKLPVLICWCHAPQLDFILITLRFQLQLRFEWLS
jgi:hypothetical protein